MTKLCVFHEHQIVGEHDYRAQDTANGIGDLIITDPDGTVTTYPAGTWQATGDDSQCGYTSADPTCPRCHPPAHGA